MFTVQDSVYIVIFCFSFFFPSDQNLIYPIWLVIYFFNLILNKNYKIKLILCTMKIELIHVIFLQVNFLVLINSMNLFLICSIFDWKFRQEDQIDHNH